MLCPRPKRTHRHLLGLCLTMSDPEKSRDWTRAVILRQSRWPRSLFDKYVQHRFLRPVPGVKGHPLYRRSDVMKLIGA